jgi:hypothetical protein
MTNIQSNSRTSFFRGFSGSAAKTFVMAASLFAAAPSFAATVVWNFNNVVFGGGPVTGTITADSDTNLVTAVDISAVDFGTPVKMYQLSSASPNFQTNSSNFIRIWSTSPNLVHQLSLKLAGTGTWGANGSTLALSTDSSFRRNTGACCDYFQSGNLTRVTAVPEPSSWAMLIAGFGIVGAAARRRRMVVA